MGRLTVALVVVLVGVGVLTLRGGEEGHIVRADLGWAGDVIPGIEVRSAGQVVGKVDGIEATREGRAEVTLRIDERIWPLPEGTQARPRFGSTIAYSGRWIELHIPRASPGAIPEGGKLVTVSPVEVDEILSAFDATTRRNLADTVSRSSRFVEGAEGGLSRTIDRTPATLAQVNALFRELSASEAALHGLLVHTDRVVHTMVTSDGGIGEILEGAATTFAATNDRADRIRELLERMPAVLAQGRATLGRVDGTLREAQRLARGLGPGVTSVRSAAPPLNRTLRTLADVAPTARATLRTAREASPDLSVVFERLRDFAPGLSGTLTELGRQLACIRPYAPEIAGMASTWTSFLAHGDSRDKYARILGTALPFPNALPAAPPALGSLVNVAFPRPPGQLLGQPWYIEDCGVGEGVLDIDNDPEIKRGSGGPG